MSCKQSDTILHLLECYRILKKTGSNVVKEILRQSPEFCEWDHYPPGDVFDRENASQYYYHAHPSVHRDIPVEHGHFHLFLHRSGMSANPVPLVLPQQTDSNQKDLAHLIAISMNDRGFPIGLFTTNRWVTGESWYAADDVCQMLDTFTIDHAFPSWPTNIWLTHLVKLFKAEIVQLIHQRDKTIDAWRRENETDVYHVYEDRKLEITSYMSISVEQKILSVQHTNQLLA